MREKSVFTIAIFISFICHCAVFAFTSGTNNTKKDCKTPMRISIYEMKTEKKVKEAAAQPIAPVKRRDIKKSAKIVKKEKKEHQKTLEIAKTLPPINREITNIVTEASPKTALPVETLISEDNNGTSKQNDETSENKNIHNLTKESEKVYSPAHVSKNPRLLKYVEPEYPEDLKDDEIEGQVIFNIIISPTGIPSIVSIKKSDDERFNESAIKAVKNSLFTPAELLDGTKVACKRSYAVTFKLED